MYATNEFKKGIKIELDGDPYVMVDNEFVKPGKGQAFNRVRLKNMITGRVVDKTYKSGEKVKKADVLEQEMQYLYDEGDEFVFMNTENYEQVHVAKASLGDSARFLVENEVCSVVFHNGLPITVELPNGQLKRTRGFGPFKTYPKVEPGSVVTVGPKPPKKERPERPESTRSWKDTLAESVATATSILTLIVLIRQINR